jgi:5-methylcytosine-specific restriction endonuclease McrA
MPDPRPKDPEKLRLWLERKSIAARGDLNPMKRSENESQKVSHRRGVCPKCGQERYLVEDHILAKGLGGHPTDPGNLQYICYDCHVDKTAEDLRQMARTPESKERMRQVALERYSTAEGRARTSEAMREYHRKKELGDD